MNIRCFTHPIGATLFFVAALLGAPRAAAAAEAGDVVQATNVGVPVWQHNFTSDTTTTAADKLSISEFVGAHYFVTDRIRVGMMVQLTDQFTGALAKGADRWSTFALLPQVGWHFYKRFFVAGVFTYAPRSGGTDRLDLGVQAVAGGSVPITDRASFSYAVEIPYNFHVAQSLGITPLVGLAFVM